MPLHVITTPPSDSDFTPLNTHQAETPATFFSEIPILHFHDPDASIVLSKSDLASLPIFLSTATFDDGKAQASASNGDTVHHNDEDIAVSESVLIPKFGVWVTSKYVFMF
jgi:nucleotide-sensitive chloride channel 1A